MKNQLVLFLLGFLITPAIAQQNDIVITADVENFWQAYDSICSTTDSGKQYSYINELFIDEGTPGLKAIMKAKRYTSKSYVEAINNYPQFWNSVRKNTLKCQSFQAPIEAAIHKLKMYYPGLKPAKIYFTMGALWSNGTTLENMVLIGTELALANEHADATELNSEFPHLKGYFMTNPATNIVFLNVHEYVHTQQKTTIGNHLLAQTIIEGVAEFVAVKVLETPSPNPQIAFGKANNTELKLAFEKEMFSPYFHNWLWNSPDNQFGMRDLAYYVGCAICEAYYQKAENKTLAIQEMIELDYNNNLALCNFIDASQYFDFEAAWYQQKFESTRPFVTAIKPFTNGSKSVNPNVEEIELVFSEPMDVRYTDFYCSTNQCLNIIEFVGFSEDSLSFKFKVDLIANKTYNHSLTHYFCSAKGVALKPYLIAFKTSAN